jgi:hypothetical protein
MWFKDWFPYYWFRAYPFILILGIAGLAYEIFCPKSDHAGVVDLFSGAFIGLALVGAVFKRSKSEPSR